MRNDPAVLLWGDFDGEQVDLAQVAAEFGWVVRPFDPAVPFAVAVVVDAADAGDWRDRVHASSRLLPGVPVLLARGFDREQCDCDPAHDGVFDEMLRPLDLAECRQSLGFVYQRVARERRRLRAVPAA